MPSFKPNHIPSELETSRLRLRYQRATDAATIHASVLETLDDLRRFPGSSPWAEAEPSLEATETRCKAGERAFLEGEAFPFVVLLKSSGEHVGNVGLHSVDWSIPKGELGYWCRRSHQGKGLMLEAVRAVAGFAFETLGLRRVQAQTHELNVPSCRLCERAGLELEAVLRHDGRDADGELGSTRIYARIR
ncbi:MAG TPA: GNAT family N-acetyltransferase [Burkholderiaceae bacterium]|jgi:hypothetical protein